MSGTPKPCLDHGGLGHDLAFGVGQKVVHLFVRTVGKVDEVRAFLFTPLGHFLSRIVGAEAFRVRSSDALMRTPTL